MGFPEDGSRGGGHPPPHFTHTHTLSIILFPFYSALCGFLLIKFRRRPLEDGGAADSGRSSSPGRRAAPAQQQFIWPPVSHSWVTAAFKGGEGREGWWRGRGSHRHYAFILKQKLGRTVSSKTP